MIASLLSLSLKDLLAYRAKDEYSLHRIVYSLFQASRNDEEKNRSIKSGMQFSVLEEGAEGVKVLILSDRTPQNPLSGKIEVKSIDEKFLDHSSYSFEITLSPTRRDSKTKKLIPILQENEIVDWFFQKVTKDCGFTFNQSAVEITQKGVQRFQKEGFLVTHNKATLKGVLQVIDKEKFVQSFKNGIGRGRAFGFGLLRIIPKI